MSTDWSRRRSPFDPAGFSALLFDMDGTLLTSIDVSQRVWGRWAARFGLDASSFLPQSHGMQVAEVIERLGLPGVNAAEEADAIGRAELADLDGIAEVPGAGAFLRSLPPRRWGVVTSAPRALAMLRMRTARLSIPELLISSEDIPKGKPDPSCYQMAARQLGLDPRSCLAFEDAPAGVRAAVDAGCSVLVITGSGHSTIPDAYPRVPDFTGLEVLQRADGALQLVA